MRLLIPIFLFVSIHLAAQNTVCPDLQRQHIIIIGSSTAAGAGATAPDSSWVGRYRNALQADYPNVRVTNLAQGGYTSYQLMPDAFVPPTDRPDPDVTRNISQAINLKADVIILNLPSNDVALGHSSNEQLSNLKTIADLAAAEEIDFYLSTTQPRNFPTDRKQQQLEVRDRMYAEFGDQVIEFWTPLVGQDSTINPIFDSGDGVHVNDEGHRLLFEQVQQKGVFDKLLAQITGPQVIDAFPIQGALCSSGFNSVALVIENATDQSFDNFQVITYPGPPTHFASLGPCATDTVIIIDEFIIADPGLLVWLGYEDLQGDTLNLLFQFPALIIAQPAVGLLAPNFLCGDDTLILEPQGTPGPFEWSITTPRTFDTVAHLILVPSGDNPFRGRVLKRSAAFSIEDSLQNTIADRPWNGVMFDLFTRYDVTLTELATYFQSTGSQGVTVYYRNGSNIGFENDPTAWTQWWTDTVTVDSAGQLVDLPIPPFAMSASDTIAFYIHLNDPNAQLIYRVGAFANEASPLNVKLGNSKGVTHTFGLLYEPRAFAGSIRFRKDFSAGLCANFENFDIDRSTYAVELSADTLLVGNEDPVIIEGPGDANFYEWSLGQSDSSTLVVALDEVLGEEMITLTAGQIRQCQTTDTLYLAMVSAVDGSAFAQISVFPNPTATTVQVVSEHAAIHRWQLSDTQGRIFRKGEGGTRFEIAFSNFPKGSYLLTFQDKNGQLLGVKKVVRQ